MYNGFYKELIKLRAEGLDDAGFGFLENIEVGDYFYLYDFLHGHCDEFAAALSDYYGYEIEYIIQKNGLLAHAYCVTEINGAKAYVDARGITTNAKLFFDEFADFCSYKNGKFYGVKEECQVLSHKNTREMYNDNNRELNQDNDLVRFFKNNNSYYDIKVFEKENHMRDWLNDCLCFNEIDTLSSGLTVAEPFVERLKTSAKEFGVEVTSYVKSVDNLIDHAKSRVENVQSADIEKEME